MHDHTKHFTFEFYVPADFFSPAVVVTTPYVIPVRYTLNYKSDVEVIGYALKPGMAVHIVNWGGLEQQMLEAAKNNSKQYRPPNGRSYFKQLPQPGEDAYWDAQMAMKVK